MDKQTCNLDYKRILNKGKSFECSKWQSYITYANDFTKQDFVLSDGALFVCKQTHLSSEDNKPKLVYGDLSNPHKPTGVSSPYWDCVLHGVSEGATTIKQFVKIPVEWTNGYYFNLTPGEFFSYNLIEDPNYQTSVVIPVNQDEKWKVLTKTESICNWATLDASWKCIRVGTSGETIEIGEQEQFLCINNIQSYSTASISKEQFLNITIDEIIKALEDTASKRNIEDLKQSLFELQIDVNTIVSAEDIYKANHNALTNVGEYIVHQLNLQPSTIWDATKKYFDIDVSAGDTLIINTKCNKNNSIGIYNSRNICVRVINPGAEVYKETVLIQPNEVKVIVNCDSDYGGYVTKLNLTKLNEKAIKQINATLGNKVDKIPGKTLTTNDYTTSDKNTVLTLQNFLNEGFLNTLDLNSSKPITSRAVYNLFSNEIFYPGVVNFSIGTTPSVMESQDYENCFVVVQPGDRFFINAISENDVYTWGLFDPSWNCVRIGNSNTNEIIQVQEGELILYVNNLLTNRNKGVIKINAYEQTIDELRRDLNNKANLDQDGKIATYQLPDYIFGQLMFGGTVTSWTADTITISPSNKFISKFDLSYDTTSYSVSKDSVWLYEGIYFIIPSGENSTIFDHIVNKGDWIVSTGNEWVKIDNSDPSFDEIIETLNTKANSTGNYPDMSVGSAHDLTGRIEATPEEFKYRPSAGEKSIRDDSATIKRIKGNSLVLNQLSNVDGTLDFYLQQSKTPIGYWKLFTDKKGITPSVNNGIISVPIEEGGSWQGIMQTVSKLSVGTKVMIVTKVRYTYDETLGIARVLNGYGSQWNYTNTAVNSGEWYNLVNFYTAKEIDDSTGTFGCRLGGSNNHEGIMDVAQLKLYNLTKMFGAGNEPTTIEEFYARIPEGVDINAYNEGELINFTAESIKTTGLNQFNGVVVDGYINDANGEHVATTTYKCTDYISVLPNQEYYINSEQTGGFWGAWYDSDKKFIKGIAIYNSNQLVTSPTNAAYMRMTILTQNSGGNPDTYCINLSHSGVRNGEYEPYKEFTYDLSWIKKYFPNGMRSAGSAYDEIVFDESKQKWVAIQRIGEVDLGSLTWRYVTRINTFSAVYTGIKRVEVYPYGDNVNAINTRYQNVRYFWGDSTSGVDGIAVNYRAASPNDILIRDSNFTDANTDVFKAAMQGVILYYELAEPIVTPIEEVVNFSYEVEDFGTEEIISNGPTTPFKGDIVYQFNAVDRIRDNSRNIEKLNEKTSNKVDRVEGKGLSSNDYTNEEKEQVAKIEGKQDALTLTVKDNGNIVLGNIAGQTKEFMPATPSGDPMHYAYVTAGATWSSSTGFWSLNGLKDITNEQMRKIYNVGFVQQLTQGPLSGERAAIRTNLLRRGADNYLSGDNLAYLAYKNTTIEVINLKNTTGTYEPKIHSKDYTSSFYGCKALREIYGLLTAYGVWTEAFYNCTSLQRVRIYDLNDNLDLSYSTFIDKDSVVYTISRAKPTKAISIKLQAEAYARLANDPDVLAALAAQPNITLISA